MLVLTIFWNPSNLSYWVALSKIFLCTIIWIFVCYFLAKIARKNLFPSITTFLIILINNLFSIFTSHFLRITKREKIIVLNAPINKNKLWLFSRLTCESVLCPEIRYNVTRAQSVLWMLAQTLAIKDSTNVCSLLILAWWVMTTIYFVINKLVFHYCQRFPGMLKGEANLLLIS